MWLNWFAFQPSSNSCADFDWELFHSMLCTGKAVESTRRDALLKFIDHANSKFFFFNEIYIATCREFNISKFMWPKLQLDMIGPVR